MGTVSLPSRPWQALCLPEALIQMRSMLSHEEKQYLAWLAAERFEGWGAIVDLGSWLGSSSAALAEGLKRRGRGGVIHTFDTFRWEPSYMEPLAREHLEEGEDFLPLFEREVGEYACWIEVQRQDLRTFAWEPAPIEILFVDVAGGWELINVILGGFGPHLIPGRSRVVLQDFRYPGAHWLPLIFDGRPDLWREVESVADGWTVTFVPLKRLEGPAGIAAEYSEEYFPLESADYLMRTRMARESGANRRLALGSLFRKHLCEGSSEAPALREELIAAGVGPDELEAIEDLESILVPRGWRAYEQRDFAASRQLAERCLAGENRRPVHAVALLGMSLLRLGDLEGASRCIDEVAALRPPFPGARLYRAELALAMGRYEEVEVEALDILESDENDQATRDYCLNLLAQVRSEPSPATRAGRLHKPVHPSRPAALARVPLLELSGELLGRVREGCFSTSEQAILLGCEIQEALAASLEVHNNRWSRRRYRELFADLYGSLEPPKPVLDGATLVELGCGSQNPYGLLFLFLMLGARRGIAIDLDEIQDPSRWARALADLATVVLVDPGDVIGDYPIERERLLQNVASFDLAKLRGGDPSGIDRVRLSHRRETAQAVSLADGEADFVISNSFLEHVTDVDDAIAEMARIMPPGAFGVHNIDGSDHRRYENPTCHPLEFLSEPTDQPLVHGSNRIRPMDFRGLFERHGFAVIAFVPFESVDVSEALRGRFVEPFRSMATDVLTVPMAKVVVRRR